MLRSITQILAELRQGIRCIDAKSAIGAINIPRGLIEMKLMEVEKDPARPIYLHCASSARALLSAEQLQRVGYENVTVITCNMEEIINSGL